MKQTVFLLTWMAAVGALRLPHAHALPYSSLQNDPAFPPTRTSRHINLLDGLAEGVDSKMFDSVVEFFFTNFGEEAGVKGRSYDSGSDFKRPPAYQANNNFEELHTGSGYNNNFMTGYKHESHGKPEKTCIDVYGLSHSSSFCLDVFAALSVTGAALLLQLLFFIAKDVFCPHLKRNDDSIDGILNGLNTLFGMLGAGNMSSLFAIDNSNTVTVDAVGGDMLKTGDGNGSIFHDKDDGQFAGCDTLVFVGKDHIPAATGATEGSESEEEEENTEEKYDSLNVNLKSDDDPEKDDDDDVPDADGNDGH
ncbi:uncharacterized protein LOC123504726 [Portunus trituberculatus]|uniref:uncharacterized protein LOC123504726 n=1 Tax=Portunus trituberculatus TaxID=210409 RepID=UPI001E1CB423|nr:uncharacterized protein LOC123504726 [Portunus trituberculatus]